MPIPSPRSGRPLALLVLTIAAMPLIKAAYAQSPPNLKPGAWEITSHSKGQGSADMQAYMDKLPPQLQEQMKKNMAQAAMAPHAIKHCARPNDQDMAAAMQQQMGLDMKCTNTSMTRSGSTYKWQGTCVGTGAGGQPMRYESAHTLVLKGDTAYEHTYTGKTEGGPMGAVQQSGSTTGKYLGPDCAAHGALTMEERRKQLQDMRADREQRRSERVRIRTERATKE
jgi:hypothetical protein